MTRFRSVHWWQSANEAGDNLLVAFLAFRPDPATTEPSVEFYDLIFPPSAQRAMASKRRSDWTDDDSVCVLPTKGTWNTFVGRGHCRLLSYFWSWIFFSGAKPPPLPRAAAFYSSLERRQVVQRKKKANRWSNGEEKKKAVISKILLQHLAVERLLFK